MLELALLPAAVDGYYYAWSSATLMFQSACVEFFFIPVVFFFEAELALFRLAS